MSTENKLEATAKNIEGKVQETFGDIVGDPKQKAEGKGKQTQAQVEHTAENIKDEAKKAID